MLFESSEMVAPIPSSSLSAKMLVGWAVDIFG